MTTTLFLFAHQDDELGVMSEIEETRARGERAVCAYLTNGAWAGVGEARRNAESTVVLAALGVGSSDIAFIGSTQAIPDGRLVEHLERAMAALDSLIGEIGDVGRIVMHAWEGGHHDHDATHLVGLAAAVRHDLLARCRQFPLYRGPTGRIFSTFAKPLAANGVVERRRIPWASRLGYWLLLRHYRSQWKVMARLAPLLAWDYLADGCQKLQAVSLVRAGLPPNNGVMLYEIWRLYSYVEFRRYATPFIVGHLAPVGRANNQVQPPA